MGYVFGKTIETAKGVFEKGQPLPPEWTGKETIRQLRENYGEDAVVIPQGEQSYAELCQMVAALAADVREIKEALGLNEKKKKLNA
jgi:hypothetical protein